MRIAHPVFMCDLWIQCWLWPKMSDSLKHKYFDLYGVQRINHSSIVLQDLHWVGSYRFEAFVKWIIFNLQLLSVSVNELKIFISNLIQSKIVIPPLRLSHFDNYIHILDCQAGKGRRALALAIAPKIKTPTTWVYIFIRLYPRSVRLKLNSMHKSSTRWNFHS